MSNILSLDELASLVPQGCKLAVPVDYAGVAMAATTALIRQGRGGLHLVCVPVGGMQVDMLVGAGLVETVETSAVSLGEAGGAPRFNKAVRDGTIRVMDATCPAVYAGLTAAQKGVPFIPIRGLLGTDVLANRPDWRVIDNPFATSTDPLVLIPALAPDVALFHAASADRDGNVWIGRRRELAMMAYASRRTVVTVERIVEHDLLETEESAAGVLPSLYVDAVAVVPAGAAPYPLWGEYAADAGEIARYARAARTDDGFQAFLRDRLDAVSIPQPAFA